MAVAATGAVITSTRFPPLRQHLPLHQHLPRRVSLQLHGTTARVEIRRHPLGSELKRIAHNLSPFPPVAVLMIIALSGVPVHAAEPPDGMAGSNLPTEYRRAATAHRLSPGLRRDQATARNLKALSYNLGQVHSMWRLREGLGREGDAAVGLKVPASTSWSPRIVPWNGTVARSMGDYSERSSNMLNGSMSFLPRDMQSRFTFGRHRIDVHIATAF